MVWQCRVAPQKWQLADISVRKTETNLRKLFIGLPGPRIKLVDARLR
jgi:hypothetical protein